jgi:hypothetical protein
MHPAVRPRVWRSCGQLALMAVRLSRGWRGRIKSTRFIRRVH